MSVIIVADIHLCQQRPDLTAAFVQFLEDITDSCETLYMLGDIFEAWIGDDYSDPSLQCIINALQALSNKGVQLFFQHGNRDFLVGQSFAALIKATLLTDKEIVVLANTKTLLMHGDQLCTDDVEYQHFRSMVRSPAWQQDFLKKPIAQRLLIAEQLRAASKEQGQLKSSNITDVNQDAVERTLLENQVPLLIHGHTHRPGVHKFQLKGKTVTRMVLGDWDKSLWYIKCSESSCELIECNLEGIKND